MRVRTVPGTALQNDRTGEIIYTPPAGEAVIRDLLANWERLMHDATELDPLIRMAVGHYPFEAIHPGNGRSGRVLNSLFFRRTARLSEDSSPASWPPSWNTSGTGRALMPCLRCCV